MQREVGKFKEDVAREKASTPDAGASLAEGLRSLRHVGERISGGKYARMGMGQGFGPDKQGKAKLSEEASRALPGWMKSKEMKVAHSVTDHKEKKSARAKFDAFVDRQASSADSDDKYR